MPRPRLPGWPLVPIRAACSPACAWPAATGGDTITHGSESLEVVKSRRWQELSSSLEGSRSRRHKGSAPCIIVEVTWNSRVLTRHRTASPPARRPRSNDAVFAIEPNDHAICLDVKRYLAAQRTGTHKTKHRGEVSGSTRKLHKQKGTGGSRQGKHQEPALPSGRQHLRSASAQLRHQGQQEYPAPGACFGTGLQGKGERHPRD
jgi:hypothetical protein